MKKGRKFTGSANTLRYEFFYFRPLSGQRLATGMAGSPEGNFWINMYRSIEFVVEKPGYTDSLGRISYKEPGVWVWCDARHVNHSEGCIFGEVLNYELLDERLIIQLKNGFGFRVRIQDQDDILELLEHYEVPQKGESITFEDYFFKYLDDRAIVRQQAEQIIKYVQHEGNLMGKNIWKQQIIEQSDVFLITASSNFDALVLEWFQKEVPQAWQKSFFE